MNLDEFEKILIDIQNNTNQTKILQAMMALARDIQAIKDALSLSHNKINELVTEVNALKEKVFSSIEQIDKQKGNENNGV